jgi:hypothetical protein
VRCSATGREEFYRCDSVCVCMCVCMCVCVCVGVCARAHICVGFVMCVLVICILALFSYPDWGFSVLFPQLQGKPQGKTCKDGAQPALFPVSCFLCCSVVVCVFYVSLLFVCKCVLYYCHRVSAQLEVTNIPYHNTGNTWNHCVNSKLSVIWKQWCRNCLILLLNSQLTMLLGSLSYVFIVGSNAG